MTDAMIQQLAAYIAKTILKQPNRTITADEALLTSGLIDSFSLVDVALYVEDTFGVHIDDTELNPDHFNTLNDLARIITERQK